MSRAVQSPNVNHWPLAFQDFIDWCAQQETWPDECFGHGPARITNYQTEGEERWVRPEKSSAA
jgi:hypothetical protein